jgi:MraZ protein
MWQKIAQDVINGSFINKNIRDTSRFLVGSATEIQTDKQGRFIIPQALFDHAQLKEDVVFIGLVNWVEVWDKDMWQKRLEYLKKNGDEIAQELTNMNNKNNG